jgi:hypothetical protein
MISKYRVKIKDLIPNGVISWSKKQLELVNNIHEYDEKIDKIWVSKYNEIIDGNHRHTILMDKHGGDYEINVVKFNVSRKTYYIISFILLPFTLTLIYPIYLIKEKFKTKK